MKLDEAKLPQRIEEATRAIHQRLEELSDADNAVGTEDYEVLYGALTTLTDLRKSWTRKARANQPRRAR